MQNPLSTKFERKKIRKKTKFEDAYNPMIYIYDYICFFLLIFGFKSFRFDYRILNNDLNPDPFLQSPPQACSLPPQDQEPSHPPPPHHIQYQNNEYQNIALRPVLLPPSKQTIKRSKDKSSKK